MKYRGTAIALGLSLAYLAFAQPGHMPRVPSTAVAGTILDADGDPVPETQVSLAHYMYAQGRLQIIPFTTATTDDRGRFRFANVPPGRAFLRAVPPVVRIPSGPNVVIGESVQANLPTQSPLNIAGDPIENLKVRLPRAALFTVRGTFQSSKAVDSYHPWSLNVSPVGHNDDLTTADVSVLGPGGFQFAVPPGDYVLTARFTQSSGNSSALALIGRTQISVAGDLNAVILPLTEPLSLSGTLTTQAPGTEPGTERGPVAPVPQPQIRPIGPGLIANPRPGNSAPRDQQLLTGPTVALTFTSPNPPIAPRVTMHEDGTFHIDGIEPGRYIVEVGHVPGHIQTVRYNGREVTGQPLNLTESGKLEIETSTASGVIDLQPPSGLDPRPLAYLWPVTPDLGSAYGGVQTLPTGLGPSDLNPGEYFVAAFEEAPDDLARIPSFLARFNTLATRVTIRLGETTRATPTLIPTATSRVAASSFP